MPTPTSPESRLHARGFKKAASAWGTAEALGATDEVLLVHPGATGLDIPAIPLDPALESDTPYVKKSELLQTPPQDIVLQARMRYELGALGRAIAMIYGTAGVPVLDSTSLAYKHKFQWKDDIAALFGTWVEERPSKIYEAAAAKPFRLELNFANGVLMANLSLRCDSCINTSVVNTATQIDALTIPTNFYTAGVQAMFAHAEVKMNAESGGDVSGETALVLSDFNIVIERPMEAGQHVAGSATIIEPLEGDLSGPQTVVTLNFPRSSTITQAHPALFLAGTEQKMTITLTGALIEDTSYYSFVFYFPRFKMQNPTATVEQLVRGGLILQAEEAASAPTGMSHARHYLETINLQTTDYLA